MSRGNIVSIQSHVAYGHVGNAAATFPLQRLGFSVWPIHTCLFSNHTGYPPIDGRPTRGVVFEPSVVAEVVQGLAQRGVLAACDGVLSGWLGKADIGTAVLSAVAAARHARSTVFLCDPVLGDDTPDGQGRLYAAADIPDYIRHQMLPAADVITPNRFELEMLSGQPVRDVPQALRAARSLLRPAGQGPTACIVTSLPDERVQDQIACLAVTTAGAWVVSTPRLSFAPNPPPNGTGDCLAALLLGYILLDQDIPQALGDAVSALYAILQHTQVLGVGPGGRPELAVIEAQESLLKPAQRFIPAVVDDGLGV